MKRTVSLPIVLLLLGVAIIATAGLTFLVTREDNTPSQTEGFTSTYSSDEVIQLVQGWPVSKDFKPTIGVNVGSLGFLVQTFCPEDPSVRKVEWTAELKASGRWSVRATVPCNPARGAEGNINYEWFLLEDGPSLLPTGVGATGLIPLR